LLPIDQNITKMAEKIRTNMRLNEAVLLWLDNLGRASKDLRRKEVS
jgi:hypothetical protein